MHELLAKYFGGKITEEEKIRLFSSMEKDEVLQKEFAEFQNLHALLSCLPSDKDEKEAKRQLSDFRRSYRKKSFRIPYKHIFRYAAAICSAVLLTWIATNRYYSTLYADKEVIVYEEFVTPPGQRAMVKLHDGTVVWLNAHSSLKYPSKFVNGERKVELDGEAFFEVSRDEGNPFVVSTEKLDIQVLGTKFNVFAYDGHREFNISLVEGKIKIYNVADKSKAVFLHPNERVDLIGNKLIKSSFGNMDFLLWKNGVYAFDDISFGEIIEKLELYYDVKIVIKNPKINAYKFSGKFRQRDGVESVLHTLQKVKSFSYVKDEEQNIITIR